MKVWVGDHAHENSGGMYRVSEGLYNYLPDYGVELVASRNEADVLNPHIGIWGNMPDDIPMVMSSHGMLWQEHGWERIGQKVNTECLNAYRRAEVVTAPSHFVARSIARYTGAAPLVVQHGIDVDKWVPNDISQDYVLWNKARMDAANNPLEMNTLARMAPETVFYSTYGKEEDNVFIFGLLKPDDMYEMVSQAGVYLSTSKESGGPCFGVLEAMACGVPVLGWDFGGTSEVIEHLETGYLAEPYNYDDLLEGLYYCLDHKERLGTNARQAVIDNYQWQDTIAGYVNAYERALFNFNDVVSVIIPCYNLGRFLPQCLDSVLSQTYANLEVVVVDDASTDNSWEIIKQYAQQDNRIFPLRNEHNRHVSQSRNTAIQVSRGQFILPLDADDRLYPNAIERMVAKLQSDRKLDIVTGKLHIYHETALEGPFQDGGWPNNTSLKLQLEGFNRLPYSSMYRRKVFERVGGYRTRIRNGVEDADFWTRALSLGYQADILPEPATLKYTHRDESLGKQNTAGSGVWVDWFPWIEDTSPARAYEVNSFDPPLVSIVVPVGPGHTHQIRACIDSVIAQTEENWELIIVNDTGETWRDRFSDIGFVRFIDNDTNHGVAWARNQGVAAAKADRIIFLDVDDVLQPHSVQSLVAAQDYAEGWIYGDWYINKGAGEIEYSEAEDWNYDAILNRSLGPITGIYYKSHVELVDGFTEDAPGWEDWDFHLKLLQHGICGTRLKVPLITYNMHLGWRREDNFSNHEYLLQYIKAKHYDILKGKAGMGCSSCGGRRTLTVSNTAQTTTSTSREGTMEDQVNMTYIGPEKQTVTYNSPNFRNVRYRVNPNKIFAVFESDVEHFLSFKTRDNKPLFAKVGPVKKTGEIEIHENPLVSQEIPDQYREPAKASDLAIEDHVAEKLQEGGFVYVIDIEEATDAELLLVKGIGNQRVTEIREAIIKWKSR